MLSCQLEFYIREFEIKHLKSSGKRRVSTGFAPGHNVDTSKIVKAKI